MSAGEAQGEVVVLGIEEVRATIETERRLSIHSGGASRSRG